MLIYCSKRRKYIFTFIVNNKLIAAFDYTRYELVDWSLNKWNNGLLFVITLKTGAFSDHLFFFFFETAPLSSMASHVRFSKNRWWLALTFNKSYLRQSTHVAFTNEIVQNNEIIRCGSIGKRVSVFFTVWSVVVYVTRTYKMYYTNKVTDWICCLPFLK